MAEYYEVSKHFIKDADNSTTVVLSDGAALVTGLTSGDVSCYYIKEGGAATLLSLAGAFTEIDAANMKGVYQIDFPSSIFDTDGFIGIYLDGAGINPTYIHGTVTTGYFTDIKTRLDQIRSLVHGNFTLEDLTYSGANNLLSATIKGWAPGADIEVDDPVITCTQTATYNDDGTLATFEITTDD